MRGDVVQYGGARAPERIRFKLIGSKGSLEWRREAYEDAHRTAVWQRASSSIGAAQSDMPRRRGQAASVSARQTQRDMSRPSQCL